MATTMVNMYMTYFVCFFGICVSNLILITAGEQFTCSCSSSQQAHTSSTSSLGSTVCPDQSNILEELKSVRSELAYVKNSVSNLQAEIPEVLHAINVTWKVAPGSVNSNTSFPGDIVYEGVHKTHPRDCREILDADDSRGDGVYRIYDPAEDRFINVRCSMHCDGGGWLELMRRYDGSEYFNRTWRKYVDGFGSLHGEFWMGLDYMHKVTKQYKNVVVRIDLVTYEDDHKYVQYDGFRVDEASTNYTLRLDGTFSGSLASVFAYGKNKMFSTYNRDNDLYSLQNCAQIHGGGWWFLGTAYKTCGNVWLTGRINEEMISKKTGGIVYGTTYGSSGYVAYKSVVMKIKPAFGLP